MRQTVEDMMAILERYPELTNIGTAAQRWLDHQFSAEETDAWCECGVWEPGVARALCMAQVTPAQVARLADDAALEIDLLEAACRGEIAPELLVHLVRGERALTSLAPHLIEFGQCCDARGTLTWIDQVCPFPIRRVFWVDDMRVGTRRGEHLHASCEQLLIAISGSVCVYLEWYRHHHHSAQWTLGTCRRGIYVPARTRIAIEARSDDARLLVLASESWTPPLKDFPIADPAGNRP